MRSRITDARAHSVRMPDARGICDEGTPDHQLATLLGTRTGIDVSSIPVVRFWTCL